MPLVYHDDNLAIYHDDCRAALKEIPDGFVDAIVTDPPYELGFMGKKWDASGIAYDVAMWREALRVLKPGGHMLTFGGTRTYHRMTCAIEDAGFEIRDSLHWIYGSGFPKSLNVGDGRGTALKPAHEPIVLARKPLVKSVADNVAAFGTGALNIDASRIPTDVKEQLGRWPANILFDEDAAAELDAQTGTLKSGRLKPGHKRGEGVTSYSGGGGVITREYGNDSGGGSRFFYCAKASRSERDRGLDHLAPRTAGEATDRDENTAGLNSPRAGAGRTGGARNFHPTVKPLDLMKWCVRLVSPTGGIVLDPFAGSGSTLVAARDLGFDSIGIEMTADYLPIILGRLGLKVTV